MYVHSEIFPDKSTLLYFDLCCVMWYFYSCMNSVFHFVLYYTALDSCSDLFHILVLKRIYGMQINSILFKSSQWKCKYSFDACIWNILRSPNCFVELPHMWLFSLCSSLDLQKLISRNLLSCWGIKAVCSCSYLFNCTLNILFSPKPCLSMAEKVFTSGIWQFREFSWDIWYASCSLP